MKQFRIRQISNSNTSEYNKIYLQNSISHEELGKVIDKLLLDDQTLNVEISASRTEVVVNRNDVSNVG